MTGPESPPPPLPSCAGCGGEATAEIDGRGWCADCFQQAGSCCAGDD